MTLKDIPPEVTGITLRTDIAAMSLPAGEYTCTLKSIRRTRKGLQIRLVDVLPKETTCK